MNACTLFCLPLGERRVKIYHGRRKKAPIRVRVNRSLCIFCCMAVLPETCGCGGTRPTLTVSHDNSRDDDVTVVPLIPTGHYVPGEGWQTGDHALVTVDDKTYTLCDYP